VAERGAVSELLRALANVLAARGIRWYVFGAQAVMIWGRPRFSADVDVTAVIDESTRNEFVDAMRQHGFPLLVDDEQFITQTRVLPFVYQNGVPLDVVLAGPGFEEEFLNRAIDVDVEGTLIPVISPEDLVITKVLAGRPKDMDDVRGVLRERMQSLDVERIRRLLDLLEQALGQSDLRRAFESEMERLRET
jgi:predicted nucleotidyltransferase